MFRSVGLHTCTSLTHIPPFVPSVYRNAPWKHIVASSSITHNGARTERAPAARKSRALPTAPSAWSPHDHCGCSLAPLASLSVQHWTQPSTRGSPRLSHILNFGWGPMQSLICPPHLHCRDQIPAYQSMGGRRAKCKNANKQNVNVLFALGVVTNLPRPRSWLILGENPRGQIEINQSQPRIEPRSQWWEARIMTTAPTWLPSVLPVCH